MRERPSNILRLWQAVQRLRHATDTSSFRLRSSVDDSGGVGVHRKLKRNRRAGNVVLEQQVSSEWPLLVVADEVECGSESGCIALVRPLRV